MNSSSIMSLKPVALQFGVCSEIASRRGDVQTTTDLRLNINDVP